MQRSLPLKGGISEQASNKTPTISVSTRKDDNTILISVRDNGPGIPSNILIKYFNLSSPPNQQDRERD
jgi:sensor histidine kinase regulating citrate/malate metabolism